MTWTLRLHPGIEGDLNDLLDFLRELAGSSVANEKLDRVLDGIERLTLVPHKGTLRHEVVRNLRAIPVDGATVAFIVHDDIREVLILSVTWGGADWMQRVRRRT